MSENTTLAERATQVFKEQIDAPTAAFFSSCVHCGICAEACLFYTETGDPKYTPINKLKPLYKIWKQEYTITGRLAKLVGLSNPLTDDELTEWEELAYDSCTMCGRCSTVCPVGNDIVYMIRKMREGFAASGHAPEGLVGATQRAVEIGSPMGVRLPALQAQIRHLEEDTGLKIPIDVEGAEYLCMLSSMEIMNFPEYMEALARIFNHAGVTWTISSEAYEATNSGIQIGASDIAKVLVQRIVDAAEKLKVKCVISPECGHAYTAIRWDGPNLVGQRFNFEVKHILEVLDELHAAGRIKLKAGDKLTEKLTYHDPCQIGRRGGVLEQPRRLIKEFAEDFVEMPDAGYMNWCCGAGGGVSSNERAEELRIQVFQRKKSQIEAVKPDALISACSNCRIHIEEGLEEYNMELPIYSLTETLAEHLDDSGEA